MDALAATLLPCPSTKRPGSPVTGGLLVSHTAASSPQHLQMPVTLCWQHQPIPLQALVDSGAEENFLDGHLASQLGISIETLDEPLEACALNRLHLAQVCLRTVPVSLAVGGNHRETMSFHLIDQSSPPMVLGFPWL